MVDSSLCKSEGSESGWPIACNDIHTVPTFALSRRPGAAFASAEPKSSRHCLHSFDAIAPSGILPGREEQKGHRYTPRVANTYLTVEIGARIGFSFRYSDCHCFSWRSNWAPNFLLWNKRTAFFRQLPKTLHGSSYSYTARDLVLTTVDTNNKTKHMCIFTLIWCEFFG